MLTTISLFNPSDYHTHLRWYVGDPKEAWANASRPDAILETVCALQEPFAQVLAMPNTLPRHLQNAEDADSYRVRLISAIPNEHSVSPIVTISLKPETTPEMIRAASGIIWAVKYYPGGVTTNSGGSSGDIDPEEPQIIAVLSAMSELGIVLSLHPETTVARDVHGNISKGFVHRAEREFRSIAERIAMRFPALKIVIEHISTAEMADLVGSRKYPNLWGSVTPQHLLLTAHEKEWWATFEPHLHCKPTLKDPEDLLAIQKLVFAGHEKVFFGSDSAPHPQDTKECAHCSSGVFSSPIALQLVTEWFMSDTTRDWWESFTGEYPDDDKVVERLQRFVGSNGQALYGKQKGFDKTVVLTQEPFTIPTSYSTGLPGLQIVPMFAGKTIGWSISDIQVESD